MNQGGQPPKLLLTKRVPSKSTPGKSYLVEVYDSGEIHCTGTGKDEQDGCVAYESQNGKLCRHQKIMYYWLKGILLKIEQHYSKEALELTQRQL